MPEPLYFLVAILISGIITVLLRALPFAALAKLRFSKYVKKLGLWMPVGIMLILAVVTTHGAVTSRPEMWWAAPVSLIVTVAVHLLTKRKTAWSVLAGTVCYVSLVALFA